MDTFTRGKDNWRSFGLVAAVALATAALVWPAFVHAVGVWSTDEEFTYGFLIPPIAVGLMWLRRDAFRRAIGTGERVGLVIVGGSIVLMLVSRRAGIHALGGLAVTPLLLGIVVYLWGWRAARIAAFPSTFLIFGLGLYRGLLNSLGYALQDLTARGAAWTGHLVGLDVLRDGLVLHSAANSATAYGFVVAQTCSGMSSLLSLLALAALWMSVTAGPLRGRVVVLAGVLPLVVLANTMRVTLVLVVGSTFGEEAALGFFHGASSLILFGLALAGLLALSRSVGCKLPTFAFSF